MKKRPLGSTDIQISPLGLGTVKFGRNHQVKYPCAFELPSDLDLQNLLAKAKELGINFLDTAPAYGLAEERLGQLLAGQRQDWVIETKVGESFENGQSTFDFSSEGIISSVHSSLQKLQTDYLDMVLVHSSGEDLQILEKYQPFSTLSKLKDQGLIRAYGMSTKTLEGAIQTLKNSDLVMLAYHLDYPDEEAAIDFAQEIKKGVLIKKALSSGHLVADESKKETLERALHFVLTKPGITSAVIGTINPEHLCQNAEIIARLS